MIFMFFFEIRFISSNKMNKECSEGYYCSDLDCHDPNHVCDKHKTNLRECDQPSLGAVEGNCIYCCFEGGHFDFQYDRDEPNDWGMADIALEIIQLGFSDQRRGFTPTFSTERLKRGVKEVINLYNQGVAMAKQQ